MNRQILYFLAMMLCGLAVCSCTHDRDPRQVDASGRVFLSVTRAQQDYDSFNDDAVEYEDRVHHLALLVFDATMGNKVAEYYSDDYFPSGIPMADLQASTFKVAMTPGTRDFYFVANCPNSHTRLRGIQSAGDMKIFMQELNMLDPALFTAANSDKGFPMSRVYTHQKVDYGGTESFPTPFSPEGDNLIRLIRTVAKVDLNFINLKSADIPTVTYENRLQRTALSDVQYSVGGYPETFAGVAMPAVRGSKSLYRIYVPEALIMTSSPTWATKNLINYVKIELNGKTYEIPLVSNENEIQNQDYMAFARGEQANQPNYNILRNNHYILNVLVKPETGITAQLKVMPWEVVNEDVSYEDAYMNATKELVTLNYVQGDVTPVQLLTTFNGTNVSYTINYKEGADWLQLDQANPRTITGNQEYNFISQKENIGTAPRHATVTFHAEGYAHDVVVTVVQLPRQDLLLRRYVAFDYQGTSGMTGGVYDVPVQSHGYEWQADVVINRSTLSGTPDWLKVTRVDNMLRLTVKPTNGIDLLREALVKVFDGSGRAEYLRVEQGNYKPMTIGGQIWLDRNMGALHTTTNINAWSELAPITGAERARMNGYYYQWGRMPDGYHTLGVDVIKGNIVDPDNANCTAFPVDYSRTNEPAVRKWWDATTINPYQDECYGKFITAPDWLINIPDGLGIWSEPKNQFGYDPCPEGYRLPTGAEWQILWGNNITYKGTYANGLWVKTGVAGVYAFFPMTAYREYSGHIENWSTANYTRLCLAGSLTGGTYQVFEFTMNNTGLSRTMSNLSDAMVARCIKE